MSNRANSNRSFPVYLFVAGLTFLSISSLAAQDCPSDLENTSEYESLTSGTPTSKQKGVEEWDIDVVRFHLDEPGVLEITGTGDESQGALFTNVEDEPTFFDSATLGTELDSLQTIVPPGDYCVQVRPSEGATGDFEVEVAFTNICDLGGADDHDDSFQCATPIEIDGNASGVITSGAGADVDVFRFVVTTPGYVTISSSGSTDVDGSLFSSVGGPIAANEDGGTGDNFLIVQYLTAGTYYVKVQGANGSYGISVAD